MRELQKGAIAITMWSQWAASGKSCFCYFLPWSLTSNSRSLAAILFLRRMVCIETCHTKRMQRCAVIAGALSITPCNNNSGCSCVLEGIPVLRNIFDMQLKYCNWMFAFSVQQFISLTSTNWRLHLLLETCSNVYPVSCVWCKYKV